MWFTNECNNISQSRIIWMSNYTIHKLKYSLLPIKTKLEIIKLFQGVHNQTLAQIL